MMRLLKIFVALLSLLPATGLRAQSSTNNPITRDDAIAAEKLFGLHFTDTQNDMLLPSLREQLRNFETIHQFPLSNAVPSAMLFNPIPVGTKFETKRKPFTMRALPK